jgi:dipeptidyl aminopeptidase/acylaminoacyl peptidase
MKRNDKIAINPWVAAALFICICLLGSTADAALRGNGKIAFTSTRDGNREIYVMNKDGSNQTRLTHNSTLDDHPTWSPDGKKIAYVSQVSQNSYGIFIMDPDGKNAVQVTTIDNYFVNSPAWFSDFWSMSWSPTGDKIVFQDFYGTYDIVVVNIDGSNRTVLTNSQSYDQEPSWSPDGSRLLFGRAPNVFLTYPRISTMDVTGTNVQTLPILQNYFACAPAWSPDGDRALVVIDFTDDIADSVLVIVDADGTAVEWFDHKTQGFEYRNKPSWSPDGRTVLFDKWRSQNNDMEIYVKDLGGNDALQITDTEGWSFHPSWQRVANRATADFDGDGRADISVFRPSDSVWYLDRSTDGFTASRFGISTDRITPADFDGDGKTDIAVYREGTWWWMNSSDGTVAAVQFGIAGDVPVPADYTGDGQDELAVYRNGEWWTLDLSTGQAKLTRFGLLGDKPVPADYDGDGRTDHGVYRNGEWHLNRSSDGYAVVAFGLPSDWPVVGDYDGDGKADLAIYRSGTWYLMQSTEGFAAYQWGVSTDIPVPADYDGDGRVDIAVYRSGVWWILKSTSGIVISQFGLEDDKPVPVTGSF